MIGCWSLGGNHGDGRRGCGGPRALTDCSGVSPREAGGRRAQPGASAPASRDHRAGRGRGLLRALDAVEAARARAEPGPAAGKVGGCGGAAGPGR